MSCTIPRSNQIYVITCGLICDLFLLSILCIKVTTDNKWLHLKNIFKSLLLMPSHK
uniref:Uncharacterized protein n=1 Tax=Anguilla anguilla TaxID=7936 RepID=A0A0E9WHK1_ANGAN